MAFSRYLEANKFEPYKDYYIDYGGLSQEIPKKQNGQGCAETSTLGPFLEKYEINFCHVFGFTRLKHESLAAELGHLEDGLLSNKRHTREKLDAILAELKEFAEFIRVNSEGFRRILKKVERRVGIAPPKDYERRITSEIEKLGQLDRLIHLAGRLRLKTMKVAKKKGAGTTFVRKTKKYWVHGENLGVVKARVAEHLPIYVFGGQQPNGTPYSAWRRTEHDTCISSVYFDNAIHELYTGRLKKNHGAEAIRIRWYGRVVPAVVFVERKRHEDSWSGERSKKLRFRIYEKDVVAYINGENVWGGVKALNGGKSKQLYREIQETIVNKGLRPTVRTFYRRNAFQLPNDASVRISIDTNLAMIRECGQGDYTGSFQQWRRPDLCCEWPFSAAPKGDVILFPHAILEVKTQGATEEMPEWIDRIVKSSCAEHVHKFSKFMHGSALLFPGIPVVPYWLHQVRTDIRKDPYHPRGPVRVLMGTALASIPGESEAETSEARSPVIEHGKKIDMPRRLEPKIHMANERTFLKWIKFGLFLAGIGTALTSLGDNDAWLCGCIMNIVAGVFGLYAIYLWAWRNSKLFLKTMEPYDDRLGPTLMVIMYIVAMVIVVLFKLSWVTDEGPIL